MLERPAKTSLFCCTTALKASNCFGIKFVRRSAFCQRKLHGSIKFSVPHSRHFENLFQACALTSPVTFLTGDHVHKSDLTRSRLRLRPQEIWVRDYLRAPLCKHRESGNRTKISNFFLFYQKNPFSDLFLKITLKGSISLYFSYN